MEGVGRDEMEGIKNIRLRPTKSQTYTPQDMAKVLPDNVGIRGGFIRFESGSRGDFGTQLPEAYVFCTSTDKLPTFGDASYQIQKPRSFGKILFDSLRVFDTKIFGFAISRVAYGGMKDPIEDLHSVIDKGYSLKDLLLDDYYQKPSLYSSEKEYRFLFFTDADSIQDETLIECKKLLPVCTF